MPVVNKTTCIVATRRLAPRAIDIVAFLLNHGRGFSFVRLIRHAAGEKFRVLGEARWTRSDAPPSSSPNVSSAASVDLAFEESGELTALAADGSAAGPPTTVRAAYAWRVALDGAVRVSFPDGRLFFDAPSFGAAGVPVAVAHSCAPDEYRGELLLLPPAAHEPPALRVTWRVSGPRKAYESVTTFSPLRA